MMVCDAHFLSVAVKVSVDLRLLTSTCEDQSDDATNNLVGWLGCDYLHYLLGVSY